MFVLDFWYESNSCWGRVNSFYILKEMLDGQLEESNCIETIDDFLDKSYQNGTILDFGTRREHDSEVTLRDFLIIQNCLDDFLIYCEEYK